MPRMGAENRAAQLYKTRGKPPEPPHDLPEPARDLWRTIVGSLPADYFPAFSQPALGLYCRALVEAERVAAALEKAAPGSDEAKVLTGQLRILRTITTSDARSLRLTLQSRITPKSGKLDERGDPIDGPFASLIGGAALRQ
jgi:hypothetical protein